MAFKEFSLDDDITITVYKRVGSRSLRLSVTSTGKIRVTIPSWSLYLAGVQFARTRLNWIKQQQSPRSLLLPDQKIGKAHHLKFVAQGTAKRVSTRVLAGQIIIGYPHGLAYSDVKVQTAAKSAALRALRREAEQLLPQRLSAVAANHGFSYATVGIKQLKSRWGSCDQSTNIILNLFLMQLPWELIDYVLIHELIHTKHLHHGPEFWQAFEAVLPNAKQLRAVMRGHQPMLTGAKALE
jgi:predicted metal-dependent hydrolase